MPNETTAVKNCDVLRNRDRKKTARQAKRKKWKEKKKIIKKRRKKAT